MTIVDVAVDNGSFETLVAALTEAELVSALEAEGPSPSSPQMTMRLQLFRPNLEITAADLLANPN